MFGRAELVGGQNSYGDTVSENLITVEPPPYSTELYHRGYMSRRGTDTQDSKSTRIPDEAAREVVRLYRELLQKYLSRLLEHSHRNTPTDCALIPII